MNTFINIISEFPSHWGKNTLEERKAFIQKWVKDQPINLRINTRGLREQKQALYYGFEVNWRSDDSFMCARKRLSRQSNWRGNIPISLFS